MKRYLALLLLLALPLLAGAQVYTPVIVSGFVVDDGTGSTINPPSGSDLCFLGTNGAGDAITYTPQGGSPVSGPVCQTFTSGGNLSGSFQVANADTATPAGLFYTITITNGATTYLTIPHVSVSGSLFNFGTYAIPGNGRVEGIGYPHIACNIGAQWTSTTVSPGAATCSIVSGIGSWISYPQGGSYCPAGQGYITPQVQGLPFCISPTLNGLGPPSGSCLKNSTYIQQDAANGQFFWGCVNSAWQQITGSGGASGLTSFQGRTTAAATLQTSDIQGILSNSPYNLTGSGNLVFDSGTGVMSPTPFWNINGAGMMVGVNSLLLGNGTSDTIALNPNGAAVFAGGAVTISTAGVTAMAAGSTVGGSLVCTASNGLCDTGGSSFYQNIQNSGTSLTPRANTNFIVSSGITGTDDPSNASTDISLSAIPNASLANSSIIINVTGGATGGGVVQLGGSTSIDVTGGALGPYVPVTGAPTGTIPAGGILAYNDNPAGGIANGTDLLNQPNGTTPAPDNGGFNFVYVDPSNVHHYLGGINDMGDFGVHGGMGGNWVGGQNSLASLAYLLAFNNHGVGNYISFNEMDGTTSGISHFSNITDSGSEVRGWSFDTGDITGTTLTTVITFSPTGDGTFDGQVTGSSLSTGTPTVGVTCTVDGFITLIVDNTSRKVATCVP